MLKTPQDNSNKLFDVREVGIVVSVKEFIAEVEGLPSCMNGQMVTFSNGDVGMVMGFDERKVFILSFGSKGRIRAGFEVYSRNEPFLTPVGENFVGRTVTSLGEPFDGLGSIKNDGHNPIFRDAPGVMEREPVKDALETGIRSIDSSFPIARGQRQLLIGDQMTGKTTIITDTILNQKGKNVICIYCAIGQSRNSFLKVVRLLKERDAMDYSIVVSGIASAPLGEQYLAPYTACALAEYFAARGRDVFIGFDDLGKHAWAYRQFSLLLERSPGREAYPGDIFYIHSQLLERAGKFSKDLGGGTVTFFPVVSTIQGDITGYIQTNLISITDGQLYLNTNLFQRGFRPAVDFGLSVSRIGNRAQCEAMKEVSGKLRLEYLQYQELERMSTMNSQLSEEAEARLRRGETVSSIFTQPNGAPSPLGEQVLLLYAVRTGFLEEIPHLIPQFKKKIYGWMKEKFPDVVREIEEKQVLTDELKKKIEEGLKEFIVEEDDL